MRYQKIDRKQMKFQGMPEMFPETNTDSNA